MGSAFSGMMERVRSKTPLVHFITNYVTVNDVANACICCGGSPVMTDEIDDVRDMVPAASAVVLNIGTLNRRTVESMLEAGRIATERGAPVVLDPVGAGATPMRTETARRIIGEADVSVIKGNAGEICVLAGSEGAVRGVDSLTGWEGAAKAAGALARELGLVVVATGAVDCVSDGDRTVALRNGSPMLESVSGGGCMLSGVVGAYAGACGPSLESAIAAVTAFNVPAERAAARAAGPGTFKAALFDEIFSMKPEDLVPDMEDVADVRALRHHRREDARGQGHGRGPGGQRVL